MDKVNAYNTTTTMPQSDVVIVGLKTTNQSLLKTLLPPLLKDDTLVVLIQNGLGLEKDFVLMFPGVSVMAGLAFICSSKTEPGIVNHQCFGQIRLGNYNCIDHKRMEEFSTALGAAGITTTDRLIGNKETRSLILTQMHETTKLYNRLKEIDLNNVSSLS